VQVLWPLRFGLELGSGGSKEEILKLKAQSSKHKAQSTKLKALSTKLKFQKFFTKSIPL
jgi:hypothetical protein